jgi:phosphatidylethanolamine/phosphatidyl-N-methylethanolamine N-methyltransferase
MRPKSTVGHARLGFSERFWNHRGGFFVKILLVATTLGQPNMTLTERTTPSRAVVHSPRPTNPFAFFRSWWRSPVAVGLPFASSPWTARRLARTALDAGISGGPLLELGAGTGSITEALIALGCPSDKIVAVERDAQLCRLLEKRFKGLHVLHGNALQLGELLGTTKICSVRTVLSGLPMRAIPLDAAARCYSDAFRLMPSGGAIIQYTYGLRPPVDPDAARLKLEATFLGREWRNFPPVGIWKYRVG